MRKSDPKVLLTAISAKCVESVVQTSVLLADGYVCNGVIVKVWHIDPRKRCPLSRKTFEAMSAELVRWGYNLSPDMVDYSHWWSCRGGVYRFFHFFSEESRKGRAVFAAHVAAKRKLSKEIKEPIDSICLYLNKT